MSSLSHESIFIAVKDALQRNGIKLWEPPFYLDSTSNESEMMVRFLFEEMNCVFFINSFFVSLRFWLIDFAKASTSSLSIVWLL